MFGYIIYLVEQTWNGLSVPYCSPLGKQACRYSEEPYSAAMPRELVWIDQPGFRGWGCSKCAWGFNPPGPPVRLPEIRLFTLSTVATQTDHRETLRASPVRKTGFHATTSRPPSQFRSFFSIQRSRAARCRLYAGGGEPFGPLRACTGHRRRQPGVYLLHGRHRLQPQSRNVSSLEQTVRIFTQYGCA